MRTATSCMIESKRCGSCLGVNFATRGSEDSRFKHHATPAPSWVTVHPKAKVLPQVVVKAARQPLLVCNLVLSAS